MHSLSLGGRVTEVTRTLETTNYSPSTITTRKTETQVAPSLPEGGGVGQISQIIQNVLLNLIGGGLLASQSQAAQGRPELITHSRTFLLTQSQTLTNIMAPPRPGHAAALRVVPAPQLQVSSLTELGHVFFFTAYSDHVNTWSLDITGGAEDRAEETLCVTSSHHNPRE